MRVTVVMAFLIIITLISNGAITVKVKLLCKAALALAAVGLFASAASAAYKSEYKLSVVPGASSGWLLSSPTAFARNPTAASTLSPTSALS